MRSLVDLSTGRRGGDADAGFTLVELLIVLLILGILLGVAIPTFLGATKSAGLATAQSNVQTAFTGATSYFEQNEDSYAGISAGTAAASAISAQGLALVFVADGPSTDAATIGVESADQQVMLVAMSTQNRTCYVIFDTRLDTSNLTPFGQSSFANTPGGSSPIAAGTWYGWYRSTGVTSGAGECSVEHALVSVANWQMGAFPHN